MRNARRRLGIVLLSVIVGPTSLLASEALSPDPLALHLEAERLFLGGNLAGAEDVLHEIEALLDSDPSWDPTGVFRRRLRLGRARLEPVQAGEKALVSFLETAVTSLATPALEDDLSDSVPLLAWIEQAQGDLRARRDEIVFRIADEIDRAVLRRTETYARTERLLEEELVHRLAGAFDDRLAYLLNADERVRILKTRLDAIKRDTIALAEETDRLRSELGLARQRVRNLFGALVEPTFSTDVRLPDGEAAGPEELGGAFGRLVRSRIVTLRGLEHQTPTEKALRLSETRRYRRINAVGVRNGIIDDQSAVIQTLEEIIEGVPTRLAGAHSRAGTEEG